MADGSGAADGIDDRLCRPSAVDSLPLPAVVVTDGVVVTRNALAARLRPDAPLGVPLTEWLGTEVDGDVDDGAVLRLRDRTFVAVHVGTAALDGPRVVLLRDATDDELTRHALDAVADSTFLLDAAGRPLWRSEKLRQRSNLDDVAAAQQNPSERIHPEDLPKVLDTFVDSRPEKPSRVVVRSRAVDDDDHWETIEVVVHHRLDHDVLGGYLVQVHNLDDGVQLEDGLDGADPGWLSLTEAAPVGIVATDVVGEIVYRNRAARELLGRDIEWLGRDGRWLELARPEDRPGLREAFDAALRGDRSTTVTAAFDDREGGQRWLRLSTSPQRSAAGRQRGLIATLEDVTEQVEARAGLEEAEAQLRHLADHDPLTGLPNRASLTRRLDDALSRHRAGGPGLAVLFCDLDGFKPINDRHGHGVGDAVLAEVAARLRAAAADEAVVARLGGDEFVVLREGPIDEAELVALAGRLHEQLRHPFDVEGHEASLAVSVGIATLTPGHDAPADTLLREADEAMYEAKASGPGGTVIRSVR